MSRRHLCVQCSRINIEGLMKPEGLEHHQTLEHWKRSAATCRLRDMLLQATLETVIPTKLVGYIDEKEHSSDYSTALRWLDEPRSRHFVEILFRARGTTSQTRVSTVFIFTDQHDPATTYALPWRRSLPDNTGCDASINIAKTWLATCRGGHGRAGAVKPAPLDENEPDKAARLLSISGSHVRVVPALHLKEPYATLSYSWGPGDQWPWGPGRIAKLDLNARATEGLLRSLLPKTIKDAVDVCERLGVRYIWIDALCILQGNDLDWLQESAKMASIYARAVVNIAASGSRDKEAGLFNKGSQSQHHRYRACISVRSVVQSQPSTLYLWRGFGVELKPDMLDFDPVMESGPDAFRDEVERGALSERAWVCQERISSPRTLHFGVTQLFWQCTHTMHTEDNLGTQYPADLNSRPWRSYFFPSGPEQGAVHYEQDALGLSVEDMTGLWTAAVIPDYYSSRKLTNADDKLIAISGLAKQLWKHRPSMEYLAGLWRPRLLEGLLWSAVSWAGTGPGKRISEPYVAPSWSWASRQGPIDYGEMGSENPIFECKALECLVKCKDNNQFFPVLDAELTLEAEAVQGSARPDEEKYGNWAVPTLMLDNGATGRALLDYELANSESPDGKGLRVHALLLRRDFIGTYFLLVSPSTRKPGCFERVGIAVVKPAERTDNAAHRFDGLVRSVWRLV